MARRNGVISILALAAILGVVEFTLDGVITTIRETKAKHSFEERSYVFESEYREDSVREYEPYEHTYTERYYLSEDSNVAMELEYNVKAPVGYEILKVEKTLTIVEGKEYQILDVWFTNNQRVFVVPYYDTNTNEYNYSTSGMVMSEEETKEKTR
ncbi:MAG: hypothetical protein II625_08045 [Bacilli bacterium]|nr:hypothetical protein [Bacilli bacterium]